MRFSDVLSAGRIDLRSARHERELSARAKRRHLYERGGPHNEAVAEGFRILLTKSYWKRHHGPFNKTEAGRKRRQERRFVRFYDTYSFPSHPAQAEP